MADFPTFTRTTIYRGTPAERVLLTVGDLNADGIPEIVIGSRKPHNGLYWLQYSASGEWTKHLMDDTYPSLEAGGFLFDVTGTGTLDFIGGGDSHTRHVSWWECPDDPTERWTRRHIWEMPDTQSHDQIVADIDRDGRPELYFWCQDARTLYGVRFPDDPRMSPWPGVFVLATGLHEEGLAVADVDGDGHDELIAGQSWYRVKSDGTYERHPFTTGYVSTRLGTGDFSGDGTIEIILAEGDASGIRKEKYGRLVRFRPGADPEALWEAEVLHEHLVDPHSIIVGDFDGDGRPDVFIGELGDPNGHDHRPPQQRIYFNRDGQLIEQIIDEGLSTHEAKLIQINGQTGIAGKPYRNLNTTAPRPSEIDEVHIWMPA